MHRACTGHRSCADQRTAAIDQMKTHLVVYRAERQSLQGLGGVVLIGLSLCSLEMFNGS